MPSVMEPTGGRVVLNGVSWETYLCLLDDSEGASGTRLTYSGGKLEIMSPLFEHEEDNRVLARVVEVLAEEWGINLRSAGALTLKREASQRGLEPDSSYYIQSLARIAGRRRIDINAGDPVPDLVIEVDVTSPSLDKIAIYADFGVPEVWLSRGDDVRILVLDGAGYAERNASVALPRLTSDALTDFLRRSRSELYLNWLASLRARQAAAG
jgi:Uma2 family endonuclease